MTNDEKFTAHLARASKEVATWPLWKQSVLGGVRKGTIMKAKVTVKRNPVQDISLFDADELTMYEVTCIGVDTDLSVGYILFRRRDDYYVFTKEGVEWYYFDLKHLESVRVRVLRPGESFTVEFQAS
jgi:hypothetical protein